MDAKKRERALSKYREANNMGDQVNVDLTYAVDFNLAVCFHANKDYQEAMDHFTGGLYSMQHAVTYSIEPMWERRWLFVWGLQGCCAECVHLQSSCRYLLGEQQLSGMTAALLLACSYCEEQGIPPERTAAREYGQHLL